MNKKLVKITAVILAVLMAASVLYAAVAVIIR